MTSLKASYPRAVHASERLTPKGLECSVQNPALKRLGLSAVTLHCDSHLRLQLGRSLICKPGSPLGRGDLRWSNLLKSPICPGAEWWEGSKVGSRELSAL